MSSNKSKQAADVLNFLYSASQVRDLDRRAIEEFDIPDATLMARAADALFQQIDERFDHEGRLAIVCGPGNNGGDGYTLARILAPLGWSVTVYSLGNPENSSDVTRDAYLTAQGTSCVIEAYQDQDLDGFDVIVDAIFGSGLARAPVDLYAKAIEAINESSAFVLAADVPSGLDATTGQAFSPCVRADATVTFVGQKRGLLTADGPDHSGELCFDSLELPDAVYGDAGVDVVQRLTWDSVQSRLPARPKNSHKGRFGHAVLVGGNQRYPGALLLSGKAALLVGSGLVTLGTRSEHTTLYTMACPELLTHPLELSTDLQSCLERATVLALGPGLDQDPWANGVFDGVLDTTLPLVVDADGLNILAQRPQSRGNWILTPHPKEAARLLDCDVAQVQSNRFETVSALAKKYNAVVVLKGCGSLVSSPEGQIWLCDEGGPCLATAGSGDVLTGLIVGLLAQGASFLDAACAGVCLHGRAGVEAAGGSNRGLLASDVLEKVKALL